MLAKGGSVHSCLVITTLACTKQVVVYTSDIPGAGTGGGVWVGLQGLVHSSGPQDLPSAPLAFERGQVVNQPYSRRSEADTVSLTLFQ